MRIFDIINNLGREDAYTKKYEKRAGKYRNKLKIFEEIEYFGGSPTVCKNCRKIIDTRVDVSPDQPEIAYADPLSHGICPQCNKPYHKKV